MTSLRTRGCLPEPADVGMCWKMAREAINLEWFLEICKLCRDDPEGNEGCGCFPGATRARA